MANTIANSIYSKADIIWIAVQGLDPSLPHRLAADISTAPDDNSDIISQNKQGSLQQKVHFSIHNPGISEQEATIQSSHLRKSSVVKGIPNNARINTSLKLLTKSKIASKR